MSAVAELKSVQTIAEDDGVRERHGCDTRNGSFCQVREDGDAVLIAIVVSAVQTTNSLETGMTPRRARYLARKLYRLARRIERREVGQ
jgi:hypothetical protein